MLNVPIFIYYILHMKKYKGGNFLRFYYLSIDGRYSCMLIFNCVDDFERVKFNKFFDTRVLVFVSTLF